MRDIILPLFMCALGIYAHVLWVLYDLKVVKKKPGATLLWYIKNRYIKLQLSIIGSIAGCVILYDQGMLSVIGALGMGFAGDEVFDRAGKIAVALLKKPDIKNGDTDE